MQKHWDVMRSKNAGDYWNEVSGNLPTDFGFPIDVHTLTNRKQSMSFQSRATPNIFRRTASLRVYRSRTGGNEWEALTKGSPAE